MFFNTKIILASKSQSRQKILTQTNINFIKKTPTCNENLIKKKFKGSSAKKISFIISKKKAYSVAKKHKNILVVGSDTVIEIGGRIINKVNTKKEAEKKIKKLCGKKHNIYSSAAVYFNEKLIWSKTQKTTVKIRKLSSEEIKKYLKQSPKDILKSVGCYQIENAGPNIIEWIRGDFFNVMGFPLFPFLEFLKKFETKK